MATTTEHHVKVDSRTVKLTNLDKVMYPDVGFTKADVIDYYRRIGPTVLPHLKDRPITLKRYPNGVDDKFFYEKRCPPHRPDWVKTTAVWSEGNNRNIDFCLVNDLPTLVWAANLADLELHTSLSKKRDVLEPTMLAFDLDPGPPATIVECCQVGLWLRDLFAQLGLDCYPKTSGSKGMQVYIPLNTRGVTYDDTKPFAHAVAKVLERQHPDRVVSKMLKKLRTGKVFVDWSQNDDHKTTVTVYSLRAKPRPTCSTPITWDEVGECLERADPDHLVFETEDVLRRVEEHGDLFSRVLTQKQRLPEAQLDAG